MADVGGDHSVFAFDPFILRGDDAVVQLHQPFRGPLQYPLEFLDAAIRRGAALALPTLQAAQSVAGLRRRLPTIPSLTLATVRPSSSDPPRDARGFPSVRRMNHC